MTAEAGSGAARTATTIGRWCAALPATLYDVRIVPAEGEGRVERRRFSKMEMVRAAGWLRHRNARGFHVYARPDCPRHVLVDDIDPDSLCSLMERHTPSAIVETSPWCYQVWLTVAADVITPEQATQVARLLARTYGGDRGAADARHLGRLPGLCNRKRLHERSDGSYPWSILHRAEALIDQGGDSLLRQVAASVSALERGGLPKIAATTHGTGGCALSPRQPRDEYAEAARRILTTIPTGALVDRSRVDYSIARRLLARGATPERASSVLRESPRFSTLSATSAHTYVERTIAAAAEAASGRDRTTLTRTFSGGPIETHAARVAVTERPL